MPKASLVRDLFVKAAAAIERGAAAVVADDRREALVAKLGAETTDEFLGRLPDTYLLAFDVEDMVEHAQLIAAPAIHVSRDDAHVSITIVEPDRPRLLATISGALAVCGLDVLDANVFGTSDGAVLDVFTATDPFGRLSDGAREVEQTLRRVLDGDVDLERRVAERRDAYRRVEHDPGPLLVAFDVHASVTDTLVEVHTDDEVGLLYRITAALADLGLDVRVAKVSTLGARVVDVFYVRDAQGRKIAEPSVLEALRDELVARLRTDAPASAAAGSDTPG
jgi:[protein-PII] uridylyltransferase